jgi:hypothetical protein
MTLRRLLLALSLAVAACFPALAGEAVPAGDGAAIERVIRAQIDAFRRDDGDGALAFATPALRRQFGDGPHFLEMVRTAYPPVFRPASIAFDPPTPDGAHVRQKVELVGETGKTALAIYDMEREADGTWRIAGCVLVRSERIDT